MIRATVIAEAATRTELLPGLYAADDSGKLVTLIPSAGGSPAREAKAITITSIEFALLLNSHDLVYVSW